MPFEGKKGKAEQPGKIFNPQQEPGEHFAPEVKNVIKLTLAFAKAVGANQQDKADNLVVSPYNAVAALAMAAKGTKGKTRDELAQTLFGTNGAGLDAGAAAYAALNDKMLKANQGQVELTTANGIWTNQERVTLRPDFAKDVKKTFDAEISAEDFASPATAKKINTWASDHTKGLIKEVLDKTTRDDAAILASALYFKGKWTSPFDKEDTQDKNFTQDDAAVSKTPMMQQYFRERKGLSHLKGGDFEAVALTYGAEDRKEGKHPTMRIVLVRPNDASVAARDWLAGQDKGAVPAWLDPRSFESGVPGVVEMPRLDIKQKFDLIPSLKDLGVETVFRPTQPGHPGADFSRMVEKGGKELYVSKVSHDTVFKTDEEGSEAAAVTVVGISFATAVMPTRQPIQFKLDRSFAFALQDIETGAVLFVGAVNKPNDEMKPAANTKPSAPAR
jgi:serpin B